MNYEHGLSAVNAHSGHFIYRHLLSQWIIYVIERYQCITLKGKAMFAWERHILFLQVFNDQMNDSDSPSICFLSTPAHLQQLGNPPASLKSPV